MRTVLVILLLVLVPGANAAIHAVFPPAGELVGAPLPPVDVRQMNQRLAVDVLERFGFDETWKEMIAGRVRGAMLRNRAEVCGEKLGDEQAFIVAAFVQRSFDAEIMKVVENSNAVVRAREYLMYRPTIGEEEHAELRDMRPGPLARSFVAEWLMSGYKPEAPVEKLSRIVLKELCP